MLKKWFDSYYKWLLVGLLWVVLVLNYLDRMAIFTIFPLLKKVMGASDIVLALLGATFLWAYALFSPVGGYCGDRFSRKHVVLWSLAIFSVITFSTGLAQTGRQLIWLRLLLGVSEALYIPTALAYVASYHTGSTRSLANGIMLTGQNAGAGIGAFYEGYMADQYSWRVGFYALGIFGAVVAVPLILLLREKASAFDGSQGYQREPPPREPVSRKLAGIMATPTTLSLIFLGVAISVASWPVSFWVPTYFHDKFAFSLTDAGFAMMLYVAAPGLISSVLGGIWADRWAKGDPRGRMAVQVVGLCCMAFAILGVGFMPSGRTLEYDLAVYSVGSGLIMANMMPVFSSVMTPKRWSTTYGVYNMAGTMAGGLAGLFVGKIKALWGTGYGISSLSVVLFIAIGVMTLALFRFVPKDVKKLQEELAQLESTA